MLSLEGVMLPTSVETTSGTVQVMRTGTGAAIVMGPNKASVEAALSVVPFRVRSAGGHSRSLGCWVVRLVVEGGR